MKTYTNVVTLSATISTLERALRAPEKNTPEDLEAGRLLLRKLKEKRRIASYKAKRFTPSGRMVRL